MNGKVIDVYSGNRFNFETHINEFLIYREDASYTEAFLVEIPCGLYTHDQVHDDMEQVFYILSGEGEVVVKDTQRECEPTTYKVKKGSVVLIPINHYHKIYNHSDKESLKYLCVNAFAENKVEAESLLHAKNVIKNFNMNEEKYLISEPPVLVTGGAGFIGRNLIGKLLSEGKKVVSIDTMPFREEYIDSAYLKNFEAVMLEQGVKGFGKWFQNYCEKMKVIPRKMYCLNGNCGIKKHMLDLSMDEFKEQISDNLIDTYAYIKEFTTVLINNRKEGRVLLASSVGASHAHRELCGYDSAKAGIEAMCRSLSLDLAPYDISINAVEIGPIEDSNTSKRDKDNKDELRRLVPIQRYPQIDEITEELFRLLDCNMSVNGHTYVFDGGLTVQLRPVFSESLNNRERYIREQVK